MLHPSLARSISHGISAQIRRTGMSVADLDRKSGIHRQTIQNVIDMRHPPSTNTLAKLAEALGCDMEITFVPKDPTH